MKVYIIAMSTNIDGSESVSAFSTLEGAQKALNKYFEFYSDNEQVEHTFKSDIAFSIYYHGGDWLNAHLFETEVKQ